MRSIHKSRKNKKIKGGATASNTFNVNSYTLTELMSVVKFMNSSTKDYDKALREIHKRITEKEMNQALKDMFNSNNGNNGNILLNNSSKTPTQLEKLKLIEEKEMNQALKDMFNSNNMLNINSSKASKKSSSKASKKSSSKASKKSSSKATTSIRFLEELYDFIVKRANHHRKKNDLKRLIKKDVSNTYKKSLKELYSIKLNNGKLDVDERHQKMLNLIELINKRDRGGSSLFNNIVSLNTLPSVPTTLLLPSVPTTPLKTKTKTKSKTAIRS